MLGDSFTHGLGVLDESKIFSEILERRLGEMDRFPGGVWDRSCCPHTA